MKINETPKWFLDAIAQKPEIKTVKKFHIIVGEKKINQA